jgi:hypothetical protein
MSLRNASIFVFTPTGCTDSVDATTAPRGSMTSLANLVPAPGSNNMFVCRPAAVNIVDFATAGFSSPGFISSMLVVGNLAYGTVATSRNTGHDEPYLVNLLTGSALTVSGITAANTPVQPPTSGAWTPPIVAQIGTRVIVTHPGFGGTTYKFGWFDISGFTQTSLANTTSGSAVLTGNYPITGLQPGMTITATGVPSGDTVVSSANFVLNTTGTTNGSTTISAIGSLVGVAVGQQIAGANLLAGTIVTAVGASSVTINPAASGSAVGQAITFTGTTITMLSNATITANGVSVTIAGGTPTNPLWGAGDTDRYNLPSKPVGVCQSAYGEAVYALGLNGVVISDPLFPCRVSNTPNFQALTTNDGLGITAVYPLMLSAPLVTTGIIQAVIAFEGVAKMQQITGTPSLSTLSMNALPVATGTASPLAIGACELGTFFASPEGIRVVQFTGQISPPIGDAGQGITQPFIYSGVPSRVCGAANSHTLRFAVQNAAAQNAPWQDWWWDIGRKIWIGPMSMIPSLIQPWSGPDQENTFVITPQGITGQIWRADPVPATTSAYVENSAQLMWAYQPTALPDTGRLAMYTLVEMAVMAAWTGAAAQATAVDVSNALATTTRVPVTPVASSTIWGSFIWGAAKWGAGATNPQQWPIYWTIPLLFKQLLLNISGNSGTGLLLGNIYMKYQELGYSLPVPQAT